MAVRVCGPRNASKRRVSLENADAQADPTTLSGKVDSSGPMSEAVPSSRCAANAIKNASTNVVTNEIITKESNLPSALRSDWLTGYADELLWHLPSQGRAASSRAFARPADARSPGAVPC